jgi:hypothetical protein
VSSLSDQIDDLKRAKDTEGKKEVPEFDLTRDYSSNQGELKETRPGLGESRKNDYVTELMWLDPVNETVKQVKSRSTCLTKCQQFLRKGIMNLVAGPIRGLMKVQEI